MSEQPLDVKTAMAAVDLLRKSLTAGLPLWAEIEAIHSAARIVPLNWSEEYQKAFRTTCEVDL